jgi:hypothetical protein
VKKFIYLLILIFNVELSIAATSAWYGTASIVPGLGQAFNGNIFEGVAWFGTTLSLVGNRHSLNRNIGYDIWFYNMYDAWKDAGGKPSKDHWVGYEYAQNFNPYHLIDPFSVGMIGIAGASRKSTGLNSSAKNLNTTESILMFSFVGLGEEALFRGFLFPAISSWLSPWGGAIVSSTLFSFAHIGSSSGANAIRFVFGMIFCWQYTYNNYELGGNVFAHSWYDQVLGGKMNTAQSVKEYWKDPPMSIRINIPFN